MKRLSFGGGGALPSECSAGHQPKPKALTVILDQIEGERRRSGQRDWDVPCLRLN
jgi:hypothetical protein